MLSDDTVRVADAWWARDFSCSPDRLRPGATHVQVHAGELTGADGIWMLAVGTWPLVSLPPAVFPGLCERAQAWSRETIASTGALEAGLGPFRPARIVGPAFIGYATRESLRKDITKRARQLVDTDVDAAISLRARCDPEAWNMAGASSAAFRPLAPFQVTETSPPWPVYETGGR